MRIDALKSFCVHDMVAVHYLAGDSFEPALYFVSIHTLFVFGRNSPVNSTCLFGYKNSQYSLEYWLLFDVVVQSLFDAVQFILNIGLGACVILCAVFYRGFKT